MACKTHFQKIIYTTFQVLNLSGNKITNITPHSFRGLDTLEHLILNNNQIKEINVNSLSHLKNLKRLDLADNKIKSLDSEAFFGLTNLVELNLSRNVLLFNNLSVDQNPIKSEYLPNLVSLNLAGNYIHNLTIFNSPFVKNEPQNTGDELNDQQPAYLQLKSTPQFNDQNAQYTIYQKNNRHYQQINSRRPFLNRRTNIQPVAERRTVHKKWGNLRELDLSSTQINLIENEAFSSLSQLQILKIQNNRMNVSGFLKSFFRIMFSIFEKFFFFF